MNINANIVARATITEPILPRPSLCMGPPPQSTDSPLYKFRGFHKSIAPLQAGRLHDKVPTSVFL